MVYKYTIEQADLCRGGAPLNTAPHNFYGAVVVTASVGPAVKAHRPLNCALQSAT